MPTKKPQTSKSPPSPRGAGGSGASKKPAAKKAGAKGASAARPLTLAEVNALMHAKEPARKVGRPSKFTPALGARINALIAVGLSLRQVCALPGMPDRGTVIRWLDDPDRAEFATNHAHAREAQADTVHDGMKEIEALLLLGKIAPDVARVVLNSQQWRAERLAPKKYGPKIGLGQAEGFAPVHVEVKNYGAAKPGTVSFAGVASTGHRKQGGAAA